MTMSFSLYTHAVTKGRIAIH